MEDVEAPVDETPSAEGAPDGDEPETPSGEDDEPAEDESSDDEPAAESPEDEPAEGDDEDPAYKNLVKKFAHIKNPRDRNAAIAKAWWEKNNYASKLRRENEELRARVARTPEPPKEDEPPAPPHPDLQKLDQRIQGLTTRDEAAYNVQQDLLKKLPEADARIVELKTLLKNDSLDDYGKQVLEARLESAEGRKERLLEKWADVNEKRASYKQDHERLVAERQWTAKVIEREQARQKDEARELEQFNETFPKEVSQHIEAAARDLKAPKEALPSLKKVVADRLSMALFRLDKQGVGEVDEAEVKDMVASLTKEYLQDIGLATRKTFTDTSKKKLAVAGRAPITKDGAPATGSAPRKGPVPPASLGRGELSPAMLRARQKLTSRGL